MQDVFTAQAMSVSRRCNDRLPQHPSKITCERPRSNGPDLTAGSTSRNPIRDESEVAHTSGIVLTFR